MHVLLSVAEIALGLDRASKTDFASVTRPNSMLSIPVSQFAERVALNLGFIHSRKMYLYQHDTEALSTMACVSAPSVDTVLLFKV